MATYSETLPHVGMNISEIIILDEDNIHPLPGPGLTSQCVTEAESPNGMTQTIDGHELIGLPTAATFQSYEANSTSITEETLAFPPSIVQDFHTPRTTPSNPITPKRPLRLILVDSRRFCKTRRKRPQYSGTHDTSIDQLLHGPASQSCACCPKPSSKLVSDSSRKCDSCAESSDDDYDDEAISAGETRRKTRKRLKQAGAQKRRPLVEQAVGRVLNYLDWNAAAAELAGIQVRYQRRVALSSSHNGDGVATGQMMQEVADSLKTYWTGVFKDSFQI